MCWSFEVSLLSGLFSYTVGFYLWLRNYQNDRWHAILLFVFTAIQFWEAGLWWCKNNNKMNAPYVLLAVTFLIPLTLALEPVASLYGAHYLGKNIDTYDIMIYIGVFIYLFYTLIKDNPYPNVIRNDGIEYSKPSTDDSQFPLIIFLCLVVYPLLKYSDFNKFYILMTVILFTTLCLAMLRQHAIASQWCLYSNIFAAIALFYPYIASSSPIAA
ncbi:MAG: hypothetical protein Harvfovirus61_6 [Harvfovirus sp.]|uniref:Uncharacterized protein n=1 Tax=Harvfovirus sp. TaxID=2487768 RepID=A0A3G5A7G2_9VIRU|nr:MAG: hypothetical protein Harvfovirus61_6 [Harvfovirus sp.]